MPLPAPPFSASFRSLSGKSALLTLTQDARYYPHERQGKHMLVPTSRLGHMSCPWAVRLRGPAYAWTGERAVSILGGDWILSARSWASMAKGGWEAVFNEVARPSSAPRCVFFGPYPLIICVEFGIHV